MVIEVKNVLFKEVQTDTVVVGLFASFTPSNDEWKELQKLTGLNIEKLIRNGFVKTEAKKITKVPVTVDGTVQQVVFVGLGDINKGDEELLRTTFASIGKELQAMKQSNVTIWLDSFVPAQVDVEDVAYLATEGLTLGQYAVQHYKTNADAVTNIEFLEIMTDSDEQEILGYLEIGQIYAEATNEARTLINMPPNILTATKLAEYAKNLAEKYGFDYEELGKEEMETLGMGAILAVNKGSVEEPKMIVLKYRANDEWDDVVALVGKGVTYDTGGYSLKPRESMVGMKGDMGGAAAVLGAMQIVGETRPNKNVMMVIGATDNMIAGDAFKPDDVITSYSGKTIEVLNTDAEGRLVLADAVTYAKEQGANYIVDVATLTGGVIVALGNDKTGAITNNEEFFEVFMEASMETGEFVWRLPLTENDKKRIRKSEVADLNNSPGRDGHAIFAGGFIGEFVEDTPWIHLDIAGTSDASAAHDLGPKGGTGVMVRSIATLIERMADEGELEELAE